MPKSRVLSWFVFFMCINIYIYILLGNNHHILQFQMSLQANPKYFKPSQTQSPARFQFSIATMINKCIAFVIDSQSQIVSTNTQQKLRPEGLKFLDLLPGDLPPPDAITATWWFASPQDGGGVLGRNDKCCVTSGSPASLGSDQTSVRQLFFWWFLWGIVAVKWENHHYEDRLWNSSTSYRNN